MKTLKNTGAIGGRTKCYCSVWYVLDAMLRPIPCRDYQRSGFWLLTLAAR